MCALWRISHRGIFYAVEECSTRDIFSPVRNFAHVQNFDTQNLHTRARACRICVRACAQKFCLAGCVRGKFSRKFRARAPENPGNPSPVRPTSIFPRSKSPNDFEKCATREINQAFIRGGIFRVLRGLGGGRGSWGGFAGGRARVCTSVRGGVRECARVRGGSGCCVENFSGDVLSGKFSHRTPP